MTSHRLKSLLSSMAWSVDVVWWEPEDRWNESRFKEGQIHLLDGRKDAARFVEQSAPGQIVVDVAPWLSHPLAAQLATWIMPDAEGRVSQGRSSLLGSLRRMSIALSDPVSISGQFDRLQWQGASTLAYFLEPIEFNAAINVQAAKTFSANEKLVVWTVSTPQQVITLEVATGLPPRAWCEAVGPEGSLVVDGFLTPSLAAKPRFWVHDAQGMPGSEEFSSASEIQFFASDLLQAQHDSSLRENWKVRIQRTSQWLEILEKAATESTLGHFLR